MILRIHAPFNLERTLECGQFFNYERVADAFYVVTHGRAFRARQSDCGLEVVGADEKFAKDFFRLDDDLEKIRASIDTDETMHSALRSHWGLRLVRQELWECLFSYMISARNNIPSIKRSLKHLSAHLGSCVTLGNKPAFALPSPDRIAKAGLTKLKEAGLAFRAKHVLETAKTIANGDFELEGLEKLPYEQAREQLTSLPGVGPKIADCVCLFSLNKLEAFPVDVWIKRTVQKNYFHGRAITEEKAAAFGRKRWGAYAGYAQEYLFAWTRQTKHSQPNTPRL